jgi:hypothetical protein
VEQVLGRIAQSHGFVLDRIELLRTKRVGASITKSTVRRGETSQASLYESAVILCRAGRSFWPVSGLRPLAASVKLQAHAAMRAG